MALDQATQAFLAAAAEMGAPPMYTMSIEEIRNLPPSPPELAGVMAPIFEEKTIELAVEDGSINLYVLKPGTTSDAVFVFYHGGGWVIADAADLGYNNVGRKLANGLNATVVLVNYRKAPEHPFPTPINDSYAGLQWVSENLESLTGSSTVPIIVGGDSAGGNISAVMTHKAKLENGPKIDFQVLVYPVTADDFSTDSYNDPENQLMLDRPFMEWFWNHYVSDVELRKNIYASPLYAEDFSDLPPAIVTTAGHDPLKDEGKAYAQKLINAGVTVSYRNFPDQMHAYFSYPGVFPANQMTVDWIIEVVKNELKL